jgi:hypothetical protein
MVMTPEIKSKISKAQILYCQTYGNQFVGHTHSAATIAILSQKSSGKEPKWKGRTFLYDGPKGKFKMRSSYELFYANWMDSNSVQWIYEPSINLKMGACFHLIFN